MIVPVVLSGGSGSRLWPLSRELYPKQFLALTGDRSLVQETVRRLEGLEGLASPIVVCNEEHRFLVAEQLRQIGQAPAAILLEPEGRNTAPAIALAAEQAMEEGEDPVLLVLPADHLIQDVPAFHAAARVALGVAEGGSLVTFGVVPSAPETGYGYIRVGGSPVEGLRDYPVLEFVEKPDRSTAQRYLDSGEYLWNSGMFAFRASRYLESLEQWVPDMRNACRRAFEARESDRDFVRPDPEAFRASPADSIDYAVMERADNVKVVPLDAGWSDVGSWSALWEVGKRDEAGNVVHGDVLLDDSAGCYLHADKRLIAAIGLQDHVVIETADAILVAPRDRVQDVKRLVGDLKKKGRAEALLHRRVYRPWGSYEGVDEADRFQVKRITVNSGASLSLQMHHHRAEHWIVVRGTARVTRGDEVFLLSENESTFIPVGVRHRLENPGKIPLELIEVQSGPYLGEDDIVRFEDVYGR
ncbi:MAG: mannose-1-phosphate guanylyltransferase/mannose-6-phosphate isomerase [Gammaproteobacteria bacterium]